MESNPSALEQLAKLRDTCRTLVHSPKDLNVLKELKNIICLLPKTFINISQPIILSAFYPILKIISEDNSSYSLKHKQLVIEILRDLLKKSNIDNLNLFFNIYSFLLFEVYDHINHEVFPVHEEYKLSIMECTICLSKSLSSDLLFKVYTRENAPKLCQMIYAAIEIAKKEKLRILRITAVECIMSLARVLHDDDFSDIVVRKHIAEVCLFFLPGLASGLKQISLEDEKVGHKIPQVSIKAWGRIITLLLQDYNSSDNKFDISNFKSLKEDMKNLKQSKNKKFKDNEEIKEYLQNTKHGPKWYNETDKKLQPLATEFMKLSNHSRREVTLELSIMCRLIVENCLTCIPRTVSSLTEIVIILTQNDDSEIALYNQSTLDNLSNKLYLDNFQTFLENMEEGFVNGIKRLPRQFNSVDEREQTSALNLLIGYIQLFGKYKLSHVLLTGNHLQTLLNTLINISKLECVNTVMIEDISLNDLNPNCSKPSYKKFLYFTKVSIQNCLEKLCQLLGKYDTFKIVSDFLLDVFLYKSEHRKEAIFILNEVISDCAYSQENEIIIKEILSTYIDESYWNVPLSVSIDEYGLNHNLNEIQNNAVQVCLLVEGIGKIALVQRKLFEKFSLKLLYLVLEKAGQNNALVRAASLCALQNITISFGSNNISTLINDNMDYFSFHIERKLHKQNNIKNALNVLSIVLNYSSVHVLTQISSILQEILVQSCDRYKETFATEYLKVFKTFIECIWRWYDVETCVDPIISRKKQIEETPAFQVTGAKMEDDNCDFSDDIMGKSAEELFQEDMEKKQEDLNKEIEDPEDEEYKKPDPPLQIKITVTILKTSLHFLPSKDRNRKLLVLEILNRGVEVIKSWEDELLPIAHQIWSPLVGRFREYEDPLIINYSFQLLLTLARLTKEFIRLRTIKEVLPSIAQALGKFSAESYLKDKGSAYRYSQGYKLQLTILEKLGRILAYLNVSEESLKTLSETVFKYLSEKQPLPLQESALQFWTDIAIFDYDFTRNIVDNWITEYVGTEFEKNINTLNQKIECINTHN